MDTSGRDTVSRRDLLAGAAAGVAVLAGCSGGEGDGGTTPTPAGDAGSGGETSTPAAGTGTPTPYPERLPAPVTGDADADVTLAVFEDYACPHCADYNAEGFPEIDDAYVASGRIRYEHRDLPIPVADPGSWQAANAARAVQHRHGDESFWPYAAALFENSSAIAADGPALFASLADDQGYDGDAIRAAGVERVYRQTVRGDRQDAVDLGAEGTPTFVVNGEIVTSGFGSGTVETVTSALDGALSETG